MLAFARSIGCFLYNKVTKLKTNHNIWKVTTGWILAVSYITKLLNWKQITTKSVSYLVHICCFLYNKVTKLKTNHNLCINNWCSVCAVSYITKLLNWKQITTYFNQFGQNEGCFLYNKVTKLKTNHNLCIIMYKIISAVSYITKLLNWKQITTGFRVRVFRSLLFPI